MKNQSKKEKFLFYSTYDFQTYLTTEQNKLKLDLQEEFLNTYLLYLTVYSKRRN